MFYSHTFLAKKSPLGTVWIAAHLQRRIKKPQIDGIDIRSYADCIMFPEVPIALRLSGHLLLGLVRIYSWKVNYLFQDCNRMLSDIRTSFASVQVDLPADADRAKFDSITLPDTFALDAVQLDETIYPKDGHDNHLTTYEEITLTDQIPVEGNPYVAFYINEENRVSPSPQPEYSKSGAVPMEEDILVQSVDGLDATATPLEYVADVRDPGPSHQADSSNQGLNEGRFSDDFPEIEVMRDVTDVRDPGPTYRADSCNLGLNEGRFSDDFPEIEVMRDAVNNFGPVISPDWGDTNNEMHGLHDLSVHTMNRKDSLSPVIEGVSLSGLGLLPTPVHGRQPTVASLDDPDILNTGISLAQPVPEFQLQPSPPPEKEKARKRRKKLFFDETLVLSNADMKKQLEDASKLVGKRRKLPCSSLDAWRHKALKKERVFHETLLPGMCGNLQQVFEISYPVLSVDSAPLEASPGISNEQLRDGMLDVDMAPEQARFESRVNESLPDMMPSPSVRGEFTPTDAGNLSSVSDMGKTVEYDRFLTLEVPTSVEPVPPELETPLVHSDDRLLDDTVPEIPGLLNSPDEELNFLGSTNISSTVGYDADSLGNMSARTRAVAQYLKEYSPATQVLKGQPGNLSLNKILEGKKRNQCARMFFETLVLKSYEFIDARQDEAYGDILISVMPKLTNTKL